MTPPIRISPPRLGASLELAPAGPLAPTAELTFPRFAMSPWPLPGSLPSFRLPPLFASRWLQASEAGGGASPSPAAALRFIDFLPALFDLADGIESMDLDLEHVPVNRGSGLCRYSEFTPRAERPADCSLTVYPNTQARVHGEIRPIRGTSESLITRFVVDFTPNVFNSAAINALEIDGFGGVDSPDMGYDQSFRTRSPILSMSGSGDLAYENPFFSHGAMATPFGQEVAPPPHRDFMIRFSPVETTVLSALQREVGASRLLLYAFLPTLGISDPAMFENLGIRFNTLPRRFGDLLRLFSPLFDSARGSELRQAAPYLNPNNEILLDAEELRELNAERTARGEDPLVGLRQPLPLDRAENIRWYERRRRLNARRAEQGLAPLPNVTTNRGGVIDWGFGDLARDPDRLAALPDSELPVLSARARLRATRLTLPMGTLTLQAGAEIHVRHFLERIANPPPGQSPVRSVWDIRIEPVELASLDLNAGGALVTADRLAASQLHLRIPSPVMLDPSLPSPGAEWEVGLTGVQAENLGLGSPELGFSARLNSARMADFSFRGRLNGEFSAAVHGLEAEEVHLTHSSLNIDLARLEVPSLHLERDRSDDGNPGPVRVDVPNLDIEGIEGSGRVPIHGGSFHFRNGVIELERSRSVFEGELDLRGGFPNGFSEGPIVFGNITLQPAVENLQVQGRARIELSPEGWSLRRSEGAAPLRIGFHIGPSWLLHRPELPEALRSLGASRIVETRVELASAEVQVEDLREVEFGQTPTAEGRQGRLRELHCGPISVHHLVGGGRIWVGLPIWGWVRGFFPELGRGAPARSARRPDLSPLIRHLPEEARALLGDGDFLRIGAVDLHRETGGAWRTEIQDLIFSLRESGGRGQFGGLRIPRFSLESRGPAASDARTLFELDPNYWANIFLNDPDRGGSFRFVRWPERP